MPSNGSVVFMEGGEVISSKAVEAVTAMLSPAELIEYQPLSPGEVEDIIRILSDRLESAPLVMTTLYEDVHRAEEKYETEFSKAVLSHAGQISFARHYAKSVTAELQHDVNLAKEKLRYAEWLQEALRSKLYGYLNINKALNASMFGQQRAQ